MYKKAIVLIRKRDWLFCCSIRDTAANVKFYPLFSSTTCGKTDNYLPVGDCKAVILHQNRIWSTEFFTIARASNQLGHHSVKLALDAW